MFSVVTVVTAVTAVTAVSAVTSVTGRAPCVARRRHRPSEQRMAPCRLCRRARAMLVCSFDPPAAVRHRPSARSRPHGGCLASSAIARGSTAGHVPARRDRARRASRFRVLPLVPPPCRHAVVAAPPAAAAWSARDSPGYGYSGHIYSIVRPRTVRRRACAVTMRIRVTSRYVRTNFPALMMAFATAPC